MRTKFTNAPQTSAGESEWLALVGNAWPEEAWATGMREGPKDVNVDGHPMADHVAPPPPPPWCPLPLRGLHYFSTRFSGDVPIRVYAQSVMQCLLCTQH